MDITRSYNANKMKVKDLIELLTKYDENKELDYFNLDVKQELCSHFGEPTDIYNIYHLVCNKISFSKCAFKVVFLIRFQKCLYKNIPPMIVQIVPKQIPLFTVFDNP